MNTASELRRFRFGWVPFLLLCCLASNAEGQTLYGTVRVTGSDEPVSGASVILQDSVGGFAALAVADTAGTFRLRAPRPGSYQLRVERMGYQALQVAPFVLAASDSVDLVVPLIPRPFALDPVVAVGRPGARLAGFERRRRAGAGHFVLPDEIEAGRFSTISSLVLRFPRMDVAPSGKGLVIRRAGQTCIPVVYVDGFRLPLTPHDSGPLLTGRQPRDGLNLDEFVSRLELRAIEVYTDPVFAPAEFDAGPFVPCGIIAIWTRMGFDR